MYVVRGKTYTFVIEGGNDSEQPAAYHPFYITDDKEGGYQYKKPEQRRRVKVFAGIENNRLSGDVPSGTGRLCEWREDPQQPADGFTSFGAYQVINNNKLLQALWSGHFQNVKLRLHRLGILQFTAAEILRKIKFWLLETVKKYNIWQFQML